MTLKTGHHTCTSIRLMNSLADCFGVWFNLNITASVNPSSAQYLPIHSKKWSGLIHSTNTVSENQSCSVYTVSSAGSYFEDSTSHIPSHCAVIPSWLSKCPSCTQLSRLALHHLIAAAPGDVPSAVAYILLPWQLHTLAHAHLGQQCTF